MIKNWVVIVCTLVICATNYQNQNKQKLEVFHYVKTYEDGSTNNMICVFDHKTGEYKCHLLLD